MRLMLVVPPSTLDLEYGELREAGSMYNSIMSTGKFDRQFKELLFVAASHVRNCFY